ncbi:MAG: RluA family pseudouridine synthase [Zoogloeaceae bacterium]|jgi:23S rRNA pseudouridine955/2504/2580 synthase|nr:RluA family pseudouridine synthase [Zoogloeaceae bacterium]
MMKTGKKSTRPAVTYREVTAEEAGQRLDNYLFRHCKGVPKSHIYRILRSGEVRMNKKRCDANYRVRAGDTLRLPPLSVGGRDHGVTPPTPSIDLPVRYEDATLLVIDKPAGIAVHGGSGVSFGVIETLRRQRPEARFLELAHRLDKETSGLLLIARKRSALNTLHEMFRTARQSVDKRYLMLVKGVWTDPTQQVSVPLRKYLTESGERRVCVDAKDGKAASSVFRLLARWQRFSLLEGQLKTGRTHQLRVHLAHLGFPILGDEKYGDFALNKALQKEGLKRMALHAARLGFPHPQEDRRLTLVAPLPAALVGFIRHIDATEERRFSAREMANIA